ncbi:hypothetical protein SUGI_0862150 [Cryptomeria japonica]|nr:hypothetical protein SUGI_0862150 [Cryptomeria japonica]
MPQGKTNPTVHLLPRAHKEIVNISTNNSQQRVIDQNERSLSPLISEQNSQPVAGDVAQDNTHSQNWSSRSKILEVLAAGLHEEWAQAIMHKSIAIEKNSLIGGADFKSGQTKMKSVLVDFLIGASIKPTAIVSYNHVENNDEMNPLAP